VGRNAGDVSANNTIVFNLVAHNIGSNYNTANGRFTAPIAGRYLILFNGFNNVNVDTHAQLRVNGSYTQFTIYYGGGYGMMLVTTVLNLSINDYVEIYVTSGSVYGSGGLQDCTFSGQLLG
jgi:hypothetical protein